MKSKLISVMEEYFGEDAKRINHAHRVLGYAEKILEQEEADPEIVIATAILHDIGIHAAEKRYGSSVGKYQEIEGPPIAKDILEGVSFPRDKLDEVLAIIAHHHSPGKINTPSFKVLYDADWLVNLKDEIKVKDKNKLSKMINKIFLTPTGKALARRIYL